METRIMLFSPNRLKAFLPKRHPMKKPDYFRRMQALAQAEARIDKIRLALEERICVNRLR